MKEGNDERPIKNEEGAVVQGFPVPYSLFIVLTKKGWE